jgi:hypothetical protein
MTFDLQATGTAIAHNLLSAGLVQPDGTYPQTRVRQELAVSGLSEIDVAEVESVIAAVFDAMQTELHPSE